MPHIQLKINAAASQDQLAAVSTEFPDEVFKILLSLGEEREITQSSMNCAALTGSLPMSFFIVKRNFKWSIIGVSLGENWPSCSGSSSKRCRPKNIRCEQDEWNKHESCKE